MQEIFMKKGFNYPTYLNRIYIIYMTCRNQGTGQLVLSWAQDFIYNHPEFEQLTLHVSDKNKGSIHLYQKAGFCIEKSKKFS
ncbi:hypothetical protein B2I21_22235 [Chryseobacterium mucoviscidosis]|nr:hypothetical protein B2I21_22235 [Chryseobacterium mucoviscidosis]